MRVAVVGTGISGNAAAWTLSKHYPVTVYDRELRPGGHSHTVSIDYDGTPITARFIASAIGDHQDHLKVTPLRKAVS